MKSNEKRHFLRWIAGFALAATAVPMLWGKVGIPAADSFGTPDPAWLVPGEIVVDLKDDAGDNDVMGLASKFGVSFSGESRSANPSRIMTVSTPSTLSTAALLQQLRSDPLVEAAEPEHLVQAYWAPNDPRYNEQWNFKRINMEKAWDVTKGKGAVVAVIDTGVAFEKDAKCYQAKDFTETKFTDPYDFVNKDKHPTDDNGHGTHVAGTIAESTNNNEGVAGIAFEATVMPLKVLSGSGSGKMSDVAKAIRYAADHGAHVINMSLGAPFGDTVTKNACKYAYKKGVAIVCAAGNSGREGVGYPAAYPECIAVSALGPTGEMAPYSSWGKQVAIAAPGGDKSRGEAAGILQNTVMSSSDRSAGATAEIPTLIGPEGADWLLSKEEQAKYLDQTNNDASSHGIVDDYFSFQGTSMASPHVAGVAALVASLGVKGPEEIKGILQKSAQARGDKTKFGAGELNAEAAVNLAKGSAAGWRDEMGLVGGVWVLALVMAAIRPSKKRAGPLAGALGVTIGVLLPDLIAMYSSFDSPLNLLGHSLLIPAFLLMFESDTRPEARFYGLMAAGATAHILFDLWTGSAPLMGATMWAALPWLWTNVIVGLGTFISSLRK
jgi:serine protease